MNTVIILFALFSVVSSAEVATTEIDATAMKHFFYCVQQNCKATGNKCGKDSTCCISNCTQKLNINTCEDPEETSLSLLKAIKDLLSNVTETVNEVIGSITPQGGSSDFKSFEGCVNKTCAENAPKKCKKIVTCLEEININACSEPKEVATGLLPGLLNLVQTLVKTVLDVVDGVLNPLLGSNTIV